jgi:hypothetical protein
MLNKLACRIPELSLSGRQKQYGSHARPDRNNSAVSYSVVSIPDLPQFCSPQPKVYKQNQQMGKAGS